MSISTRFADSLKLTGIIRRFQSCVFLLMFAFIICTPAVVHLWRPDLRLMPAEFPFEENRALAPPPPPIASLRSWDDVVSYPARLEPFLGDHFGLRVDLITFNNRIRYQLFGEFSNRQIALGQHGRVLLTSHAADTPFSMIRTVCGVGVTDPMVEEAGRSLQALLRRTRESVQGSPVFVIAPTATAIYPETMPTWLARQCASAMPTVPRVTALVSASGSSSFFDLTPTARVAREGEMVIPYASFHWWYGGAKPLIETLAETVLGRKRQVDVPLRDGEKRADLTQFMPGLTFRESVKEPDWVAANIEGCFGAACFASELGTIAGLIADMSRYRSSRIDQGSVLVLSDSFGAMSVGYLAEYFRDVWHFSMNNIDQLSVEQMRTLRHVMFDVHRPDQIVFLFHDASILYAAARLNLLLWR